MTDPKTILERFRTTAENVPISDAGFLRWDSDHQLRLFDNLLFIADKYNPPKTTLAMVNILLIETLKPLPITLQPNPAPLKLTCSA